MTGKKPMKVLGEKKKTGDAKLAMDEAREQFNLNQQLLSELDALSLEVCKKRREEPAKLLALSDEYYKMRLQRLTSAPISTNVIDRKLDVEKIIEEITTKADDREALVEKNRQLKEKEADLKEQLDQLREYRMKVYQAIMEDESFL
ncbi:unnamed protein product, partial [Mesorhabditis belari]|uniref:Flagellar FliJ protein n=1 Tax=Mesorhabditis belari TaxID=2138241 RepID=A0AAF3J2D7_9BILA